LCSNYLKAMVRICVSGKQWPCEFIHTHYIPDSEFQSMQNDFLIPISLILNAHVPT